MTAATQRRQKVPVVLAVTGFLNRADRQMLSILIDPIKYALDVSE